MKTQIAIFGGGVAGLWLLNLLRGHNVDAILIENNQLGGGQTIYSQGIIHSGLKYALQGKSTLSADAMRQMPTIWRQCLQGDGEIDLSTVKVLSGHQYLWSPGSIAANLAVFLASKNLKGQVSGLTRDDYPEIFSAPDFKGVVYRLEEPILAVQTLVEALAQPHVNYLLQADLQEVTRVGKEMVLHLHNEHTDIELTAEHIVLLAGKGNQALAEKFSLSQVKMQVRPLLMVAVKMPNLPRFYGHAMQVSDKPRITITTHGEGDNTVWYLGGDLAETGVARKPEQQIDFARKELQSLFPHINFSTAIFSTFYIERAEAFSDKGKKPDGPVVFQEGNVIAAWPTKLAFAPLLAQQIVDRLLRAEHSEQRLEGSIRSPLGASVSMPLNVFMQPVVANYPWS